MKMMDYGAQAAVYAAQAANQDQPERRRARLIEAREEIMREIRRLEGTIAGINRAIELIRDT